MLHRPSCSTSRVSSTLHHVGLQPRLSPHLEVVPHDEGQLPEAGECLGGAGRDHAVVEYLVVQGVGPAGGLVLGGGHTSTLSARLLNHIEQFIPSYAIIVY